MCEQCERPLEPQPLTTRISEKVAQMVDDLRDADLAFAQLAHRTDLTAHQLQIAETYVTSCRKDLFTYLALLEARVGVRRNVVLRF